MSQKQVNNPAGDFNRDSSALIAALTLEDQAGRLR
jgi:hypothetical protein